MPLKDIESLLAQLPEERRKEYETRLGIMANPQGSDSLLPPLNEPANPAGDAVAKDADLNRYAGLVSAGGLFGGAYGSKANTQGGDILRAQANNLKQQQAAAAADPESPQSQLLRSAISKFYPDVDKLGVDISQLAAGDSDVLFKPLELRERLKAREAEASARTDLLKAQLGQRADAAAQSQADRRQQLAMKQAEFARPSDKQVEALTDIDKTLDNISAIEQGFNEKDVGPLAGRIPDIAVSPDQAQFRATVGMMEDAYRRLVTGSGASAKELAILKSRIPEVTDTPEQFQAKLAGFKSLTNELKARTLQNMRAQGKNVDNFDRGQTQPTSGAGNAVPANATPQADIQVRRLKDGRQVRVRRLPNGKYEVLN